MQTGGTPVIPPAADLAHSGTSSTSPAPIHPAENLVVRARNEVKDATPAHADREERVGETGKAFDAEVGRREGADVDSQPEVGKARAGGEQETDGAELGEGKAKSEAGTLTEEDGQEKHGNGLVDQTNYLPPRQIIIVFLALTLAVFLAFLDQTIISTALISISASFNAGRSSSWVASAYLLTSTAFQPVWGRLSDVFGRKVTLLTCVVIFAIGSLACALAQSMVQLIVFRGMQGVGGGGLLTLVLIIVSDIVSLKDRGKYQGIMEATITIANGIGPVLGGVLSEKVGWRWCFWINLPIGCLTLFVIVFFLPLKRVRGDLKKKFLQIDYFGAFLTIVGTTLVLLPLNWGGTSFDWVSGPVLGCLLSGLLVFVLLFIWEWKFARIPIVPHFIFKNRTVNAVFATTLIAGMVILTQLFYLPQYIQVVRGDSAIRSGVLVLPLLLVVTAMVFISGQIISRTGEYKPSIFVGYAFWTVGLGLLSMLDEKTSTAKLVGYLFITAFGQGQTLQTGMVAAQAAVDRSEMSVVTSTRNFLRSLGGTIALAVGAAIINNTLRAQLSSSFSQSTISAIVDDPTAIWRPSARGTALFDLAQGEKDQVIRAYVKGFQTLFQVYIGLVGLNFVIAVLFIDRHSLRREGEKELKEKGKAWIEQRGEKKRGGADVEKGRGSHEFEEGEKGMMTEKKEGQ